MPTTTTTNGRPYARAMSARFPGYCRGCRGQVAVGQDIMWQPETRHVYHANCWEAMVAVFDARTATTTTTTTTRPTRPTRRNAVPTPVPTPVAVVSPTGETYDDEVVATESDTQYPVRLHLVGRSIRECPKVGDRRTITDPVQGVDIEVVVRATRPEFHLHGCEQHGLEHRGWVFHLGCEVA